MNKWRYAYICYGASLAIVLAVAALPFSAWDFKNHVDLLTGGWHSSGNLASHWIEPTRIVEQSNFLGAPRPGPSDSAFAFVDDYGAMVERAHSSSNDPVSLGLVTRYALDAQMDAPDSASFHPWPAHVVADALREGLWASQRGAKLEPQNVFFALSEATFLYRSGKKTESYAALKRAGEGKYYNDFCLEEEDLRYRGMLARVGYRGEKPRASFANAVLLPNLSAYRSVAKSLKEGPKSKASVQAMCDLLRAARTMQRTSNSVINVLVATGLTSTFIADRAPQSKLPERTKNPYVSRVEEFKKLESDSSVDRPYEPGNDYQTVLQVHSVFTNPGDSFDSIDPLAPLYSWQATVPAPAMLLALLLSVIFAVVTFKLRPGAPWARVALPYVLGATAFWVAAAHEAREATINFIQPEFYWGVPQADPGIVAFWATFAIVVLAACQFFKRLRVAATTLACIGCGILFLWTFPNPNLFLPPLFFLGGLLVTGLRWRIPYAILAVFVPTVCLGCALIAIQITMSHEGDMWLGYVLALSIFASAVIATNGSRRALLIAPAATLVFSIGYLGFVTQEIRANQEIKVGLDGWSKEADLLRAKAGIR